MGIRNIFRKKEQTGLHLQDQIIEKIVSSLRETTVLKTEITGIRLIVFGADNAASIQLVIKQPEFVPTLQRVLADNLVETGNHWHFEYESPLQFDASSLVNNLGDGLYLKILTANTAGSQKKAVISALKGQLQKKKISLQPIADRFYHIGRGKQTVLDNNFQHTNDIAFTVTGDKVYDEQAAAPNAYVSRAHAIIYYDGRLQSYILKPLLGGTFHQDNRTRILRPTINGPQVIDADNIRIGQPLQHKDQIELGKSAVLEFKLE